MDLIDKKKQKMHNKIERIQSFKKKKKTLFENQDESDFKLVRSNTLINQYLTRPTKSQILPNP